MKYFITTIISIIALSIFYACKNKQTINTNKTYTDIDMLGNILDFSKYKPDSVLFKYTPLLSSIEGRQPVIGPKDYVLESVLFFKPESIQHIKNEMQNITYLTANQNKLTHLYAFSWLPNKIKNELKKQELQEFKATQFFTSGTSDMVLLKDKIILYALTN